MAAEEGNKYSSRSNRLWAETLRRVAVQEPQKLRAIAECLYRKAAEGDVAAAKEIGDRIDGKAQSSVDITHHQGESFSDGEARLMAEALIESAKRSNSVRAK